MKSGEKKMRGSLSVQTKASIAYMISSVLIKGVNVLTLPVYTRLLTMEEMGVVTNFNALFSILYPVITLSLSSGSMSVAMVDYSDRRNRYQSVCLFLSSISSLLFLALIFFTHSSVQVMVKTSTSLLYVQALLFLFQPALDSWYIKQRFEYKYVSVLTLSIIITIASVTVSIGTIIFFRGIGDVNLGEIRIISQNSVVIFFSLFIWIKIFKEGNIVFDKEIALYALKLSIPLIIHALAKNILDASDRLMITNICGESDSGKYGTVYNISLMATIIWSALNSAIVPQIYTNLKNKNYKEIQGTTKNVLIIMAGATFISTIIAPELLQILTTEEYYDAVGIMPAVMIGVFFTAVYGLAGDVLMYYKKSTLIMLATIIAAATNVVLNYFCIKRFGYTAAAYTTFISMIILSLLELVMMKRIEREIIIQIKFLVIISFVVLLTCLLARLLYKQFILRIILICIFCATGYKNKNKIKKLLIKSGD